MRTICDVCESAPAALFCAADEAALCRPCDEKVHMCNKLASRHVRVGLADPNKVPLCDICENAPAFFYCEIDGTSLCLQCDMIVHVDGKRTHGRYLLLRQRVEFPGDKGQIDGLIMQTKELNENNSDPNQNQVSKIMNHNADMAIDGNGNTNNNINNINYINDAKANIDSKMIDLNMRPAHLVGQSSIIQTQGNNHELPDVAPTFQTDQNK
ncbi:hypothetical protein LUZ60_011842 [Juncus effusus]|nr:hypothetical protein LUZ60_011842 [Juncus effusus]